MEVRCGGGNGQGGSWVCCPGKGMILVWQEECAREKVQENCGGDSQNSLQLIVREIST